MIEMTLAQAADLLGLTTEYPATQFHGMSIDTRTLQPGNLFVAICGDRYDGHDFIEEAYRKGAKAAIVSRQVHIALPLLCVEDTTIALGKLGSAWRHQFPLQIVAVTGSNGKTTLKNMLASIMMAASPHPHQVLATQGTLNNQWGVPLTLAQLNHEHRYAAIEMGMNHFGEIAYLTKLTQPDIAIILNAAAAHLEGVGSIEGVARAKAEIFSGLSANGIAILNRDDVFFPLWHELIQQHHFMTFGFHPDAQVRATLHTSGFTQAITIHTPAGKIDVTLSLLGKHNVQNALAATAAALALKIDLNVIKIGLENTRPEYGRLQHHTLNNGVTIIDDTYNANPFSLQAAANLLTTFDGVKVLVLGDMKELGNEATSLHHAAGEMARQAGINHLFTYGELSENAALGFGEGANHFNEQEKLIHALKSFLCHATTHATTILVKGSRSMQMEKIVRSLIHYDEEYCYDH
jgi:UDP-N-acetylmuramoyl-tripeptide--D-alanyl-D-alanine ligase